MHTDAECAVETDLPDEEELRHTVALLSAIAHPARLLVLLALGREGPQAVGDLAARARLEQSAMSHQLRVLRDARLVRAERRGKNVFYALDDHHVSRIIEDALSHIAETR